MTDAISMDAGSVYFCALLSLGIVEIALQLLQVWERNAIRRFVYQSSVTFNKHQITFPESLQADVGYASLFIDPLSNILTSRFLLDLRAANDKLTAGGASVSAGSLQFAGADILSGQLQPFVSFTEDPDPLYDGDDENNNNNDDVDNEGGPEAVAEAETAGRQEVELEEV
ncbi:hypothetical protein OH77DRAFT_972222 [Trametes cingulata]|nr:hypothetical protein OH77DRAFT_972222 [Trametes cingulata]